MVKVNMTQHLIMNPTAYLNGKPITRELILELIERYDFIYSQSMLFNYLLRLKVVSSHKKPIRFNQILNWQIMSKSEWDNRRQEILLKYGFDKQAIIDKREIKTKKKQVKALLLEQMIDNILNQQISQKLLGE